MDGVRAVVGRHFVTFRPLASTSSRFIQIDDLAVGLFSAEARPFVLVAFSSKLSGSPVMRAKNV